MFPEVSGQKMASIISSRSASNVQFEFDVEHFLLLKLGKNYSESKAILNKLMNR